MHNALHKRDNSDSVIRKVGERGLANIKYCVGATIQRLEE